MKKKKIKKIDKSQNLFKFVLGLLSALVERVGVSPMKDFFLPHVLRIHVIFSEIFVLFVAQNFKTKVLIAQQNLCLECLNCTALNFNV